MSEVLPDSVSMNPDRMRLVAAELGALRAAMSSITCRNTQNLSKQNFVTFRRKTEKWLDDAFFEIISSCGATILLECGAHEASASVRFVSEKSRRAIAIEANPHTYVDMTRSAEKHGVITINCGLGSRDGEEVFHIPKDNIMKGSASFRKRSSEDYDDVIVKLTTIDSIAKKHVGDADVIALWVDVEGFALDVLRGGEEVLCKPECCAIKIEVEGKEIWKNQATVSEVSLYLSAFGFYPALRDMQFKNQFNIIYLKSGAIDDVDELLIQAWHRLGMLTVTPAEILLSYKEYLPSLKEKALNMTGDRFAVMLHMIASSLGSQSSRAFLDERRKR